ncbi:tapasin-related protein-like [Indicator indicator]|uniref:tapasin-related protein-like n=1 Tax=Indicator indicator TaxID=1002788 RepID=UPI0023DFFA35|nr:tapasin-related protein-like [Indicator indicator]
MGYGAALAAACLLCLGLTGIPDGIATADSSFRRSWQLPCVFETSKIIPLSKEPQTVRLNTRLLLSRTGSTEGQRSQPENLPPDSIPSFIVEEPSVDILQYVDEDMDKLECSISPSFIADTQTAWPGREVRANSSWFTCTLRHTAGKYRATALLLQEQREETPNPGQLFPGIAKQSHVSAPLLVRTTPVLLHFSTSHQAGASIQWVMLQQGGYRKLLLAYDGSSGQVERVARAEVALEEIPKGKASLLLRNVELRDEGIYLCVVSVASLTAEQTIQLQVEEKPTVTTNVASLSLVEGEQQKLVCNMKHYYPHSIQAQWLREPKDPWRVPEILQNVLLSSVQQSINGTYSSSIYFLLTASLKDDGHRYTCLVDHKSLQTSIRRSVTVEVREPTFTAWLLLLLILIVCLMVALWYYQKERSTAKPKPY